MNGLMMNFPLTTNYILEYGNRVFPHKHIITKQPDGSTHKYSYHDMYKRTMKLANALKNKLGIKPEDRVATFAWNNYQHYAYPYIYLNSFLLDTQAVTSLSKVALPKYLLLNR